MPEKGSKSHILSSVIGAKPPNLGNCRGPRDRPWGWNQDLHSSHSRFWRVQKVRFFSQIWEILLFFGGFCVFGRACGCCCACNYAFFVVVVVVVAVFGCVYSFLLFFVVFCCFLSFLLYLSTSWSELKHFLRTPQSDKKIEHETGVDEGVGVSTMSLCNVVCNPFAKKSNRCLVIPDFVFVHVLLAMTCTHDTANRVQNHDTQNVTLSISLWSQQHSELPLEALLRNRIVLALFFQFFVCSACVVGHKIMANSKNHITHTILHIFARKNIAKGKHNYQLTVQTTIIGFGTHKCSQ